MPSRLNAWVSLTTVACVAAMVVQSGANLKSPPASFSQQQASTTTTCDGLFAQAGDGQAPEDLPLNIEATEKTSKVAEDFMRRVEHPVYWKGARALTSQSGWEANSQLPSRHWTLVMDLDRDLSKAVTEQTVTLRVALLDSDRKERARWQTTDPQSVSGAARPRCVGTPPSAANSLDTFLGLPGPASRGARGTQSMTISATPVAVDEAFLPGASSESNAVLGATGCQIQAKETDAATQLTVTGPDSQTLTFVHRKTARQLKHQVPTTLFDCTASGVRLVTASAISDFSWAGDLRAEASISLPWKPTQPISQLRKVSENRYLGLIPGSSVAASLALEVAARSREARAESVMMRLEKAGILVRLTRADVDRIQDEYRSAHSVVTRVSDWFRNAGNRHIQTKLPGAYEFWLIKKPLESIPALSAEQASRTVFFVDKGVPVPKYNRDSTRVLNMTSWICVGKLDGCPWTAKNRP